VKGKIAKTRSKVVLILGLGVVLIFAFSSLAWATGGGGECYGEDCFVVTKTCIDANAPGEPILFTILIQNKHPEVTAYNVTANDSILGSLPFGTIEPSQAVSYSYSYYPDSSPITNVVTVTAEYELNGCWYEISAWDEATCTVPDDGDGIGCRVTGGGNDTAGNFFEGQYDGTLAEGKFRNGRRGQFDRYTFGGQAGAFTGQQPQPYGEWTHHQQSGPSGRFVFHAGTASAPPGTEIDEIICSDPGGCGPSGDPPSPAKQIDFSGVGTFKNINSDLTESYFIVPGETFHWFEVHIEDLGEPGNKGKKGYDDSVCPPEGSNDAFADPPVLDLPASCDCPDYYRIRIYEAFDDFQNPDMTNILYEVYGYINGGNLQLHYPTGYDLK
jgi:hypothetical protein